MPDYNFDTVADRRNTSSYKWDVKDGELPMWVADMDFRTAPEIIDAISRKASFGVFGYEKPADGWADAYVSWWDRRHHFRMSGEWLIFCTGVVPAISSSVRKLTTPNENVLIMSPVYNIFYNSIVNNGRRPLECPLLYMDGRYEIDFEGLESKLADPQTSLMILCNPHNPSGRIWSVDELGRIGHLCAKYGVTVISDEIHCDITQPGIGYIPFASVSDECRNNSVTCISPTKAFSIAGIQTAAVSIPNPFLRHKVWRALNTDEVAEGNTFSYSAAIAAFNHGERWLNELNAYIWKNKDYACSFIDSEMPDLKVMKGEATYLLWIYIENAFRMKSDEAAQFIRANTGLILNAGTSYGTGGGNFVRMNLGCPMSTVREGLERLKKAYYIIKGR